MNSPLSGKHPTVIQRHIENSGLQALADPPVVLLNGARQAGKTTLAASLATRTGAVLYLGDEVEPFGDRLWLMPVQSIRTDRDLSLRACLGF